MSEKLFQTSDSKFAESLPLPDDSWARVAEAYRRSRPEGAAEEVDAPFGFASRVVAQVMELRRHQHLAWWTRWSMAAAGAAALVAVVIAVRSPHSDPAFDASSQSAGMEMLLPAVPSLELPRLSPP